MSLFESPAYFAVQDATVGDVPDPFGIRIYYPTYDDVLIGAPLARGPHPLVVFAHGNRQGPQNAPYCPTDLANDHRRWTLVLGALARSGFVVAAPAMADAYGDIAQGRLEATVRWMRNEWSGRRSLHFPLEATTGEVLMRASRELAAEAGSDSAVATVAIERGFLPPIVMGEPTSLAVVGHSWGARAGALFAAAGGVRAFASIAGSFDDNESIEALRVLSIPSFMIAGTEDSQSYSYLGGVWQGLDAPKYQCALRDVGHWDWFGASGAIRRCDGTAAPWPDSGHVAGELIAGFLTRHLARVAFEPPPFIRIPLLRPWHMRWYGDGPAIAMRWDAPGERFDPLPSTGSGVLGLWPTGTGPDW